MCFVLFHFSIDHPFIFCSSLSLWLLFCADQVAAQAGSADVRKLLTEVIPTIPREANLRAARLRPLLQQAYANYFGGVAAVLLPTSALPPCTVDEANAE